MELLEEILACATEPDPNRSGWVVGDCKVQARFSRLDGPERPLYGELREATLCISKRITPVNKRGHSNWHIWVRNFNWAEYSSELDVYELEPGIEFMAEEWRMHVHRVTQRKPS